MKLPTNLMDVERGYLRILEPNNYCAKLNDSRALVFGPAPEFDSIDTGNMDMYWVNKLLEKGYLVLSNANPRGAGLECYELSQTYKDMLIDEQVSKVTTVAALERQDSLTQVVKERAQRSVSVHFKDAILADGELTRENLSHVMAHICSVFRPCDLEYLAYAYMRTLIDKEVTNVLTTPDDGYTEVTGISPCSK